MVSAYIAFIWLIGRLFKRIGLSPILGEILGGILFGPNGYDLVPYTDHALALAGPFKGTHIPNIFVLLGNIGVTFMIAESGTHIHFDKLKEVGPRALGVALVGTFLPMLLGMGVLNSFGMNLYPEAFAAGVALAPTSVGIALKLLTEANALNSTPGQTIVTAAFIDDIFSLVLLVIMLNLLAGAITAWSIIGPLVYCFGFLFIGMYLAAKVFPIYIPPILHRVTEDPESSHQPRDELHLGIMMFILAVYCVIGWQIGSHLLGAFIAGMSFCEVPRSMFVWRRQIKRISGWLVRFFFAATVAFSVPVATMMSVDAFWKGVVLCIGPCMIGKLLAGIFYNETQAPAHGHTKKHANKKDVEIGKLNKESSEDKVKSDGKVDMNKLRLVVGFAMVGRGEFAFLVAETALGKGAFGKETYAIIIWALLLCVIGAPIGFNYVLKKAFAEKPKSGIHSFTLHAEGAHHTGMHYEIADALHHEGLDVLESKMETDGETDFCEFTVRVSQEDEDIDHEKIHEIRHTIMDSLNDPHAKVLIKPNYDTEMNRIDKEMTFRHTSRDKKMSKT